MMKPHYAAQAKERQRGGQAGVLLPVKVPEAKNGDSRDQAGKAAGVKFDMHLRTTSQAVPMTIQTMCNVCNLAIKYGVSTKTIWRWHRANVEVEDPLQAALQFLAETSTADTSRIIEILKNQLTNNNEPSKTN
jgi:hypothetical protein